MKRVVTSAILAAVIVAALFYGGVRGFAALTMLAAAGGAWELARLGLPASWTTRLLLVCGAALVALSSMCPHPYKAATASLFLVTSLSALDAILRYPGKGTEAGPWILTCHGTAYLGLGGFFAVLLRALPQGLEWTCFLVAAVAAGDSGAYYTGTILGRHKLHPALSSGKTVEGTVGGLVASAAAGAAVSLLLMPGRNPAFMAFIALAVGAVAQVGDLAESLLKRGFGVKDSSTILPGHGGILDRIDGYLFAGPLLYWIVDWFKL